MRELLGWGSQRRNPAAVAWTTGLERKERIRQDESGESPRESLGRAKELRTCLEEAIEMAAGTESRSKAGERLGVEHPRTKHANVIGIYHR